MAAMGHLRMNAERSKCPYELADASLNFEEASYSGKEHDQLSSVLCSFRPLLAALASVVVFYAITLYLRYLSQTDYFPSLSRYPRWQIIFA